MEKNKVKLTVTMVMIMVMSLALFSAAYAAIYKPEALSSTVTSILNDDDIVSHATQQQMPVNTAQTSLSNFTAQSLSSFNGKNGQPAYIAINGIVYDVSGFTNWVGGLHHGYQAGKDLTQAFGNSPHTLSIFENTKVVGSYGEVVSSAQPATSATSTVTNSTIGTQSIMTLQQLSQYTGQNGQPAYIAVNGLVYEVTSYWASGQHKGLSAGADMTAAFAGSPHSQSLLNGLPIVGSLALDQQILDPSISTKMSDDDHDDDDDEDEDDD